MGRKKTPNKAKSGETAATNRIASTFANVALLAVGGLTAARTMFPSEDARTGTGAWFILIALVALVIAGLGRSFSGVSCAPRAFELLWIVFVGILWASAFKADYRYPAIWIAWEWTAIAACWFAVRLATWTNSSRFLSMLIVAGAVGQSVYCCVQEFSVFPELRKRYERGDPELLKEIERLGLGSDEGGSSRIRDRLESKETPGTFGLANTLAGFLALALPLLVFCKQTEDSRSKSFIRYGFCALVIFGLMLTRSRTAWVAGGTSLLAYWVMQRLRGNSATVRVHRLAFALLLLVGAVGGLAYTGIFDRLVLLESSKSLRYRFEYWQGALNVIRERPLLGVGFGNFQSHYLKYKLPQASEEVEDPHNFVFELWADAGPLAAVAYLLLGCWATVTLLTAKSADDEGSVQPKNWMVGTAGLFGLGLTVAFSSVDPEAAVCLALAYWIVPPLLGLSKLDPTRLAPIAAVAVLGLHVNLLGAGGIGFPGLMLSCWVLAASALPENRRAEGTAWIAWIPTIAGLSLAVTFENSLLSTWSRREQILDSGRISGRDRAAWLQRLTLAAECMPEDQTAWTSLAQACQQEMAGARDIGKAKVALRQALDAWEKASQLEPQKPATFRAMGQLYAAAGERGLVTGAWQASAANYSLLVLWYPNSARNHLEFAESLVKMGDGDKAAEHFREALRLDDCTPHVDKKLPQPGRLRALTYLQVMNDKK